MFCKNCGAEFGDGSKFCPQCGSRVDSIQDKIDKLSDKVDDISKTLDKQVDSAIDDVRNSINGNNTSNNQYSSNAKLNTNRSLVAYILLTIITCGIYGFYFVYSLAHDVNIACHNDGERTPGLATYLILSFITCGFYSLYWEYKVVNRIYNNQKQYNLNIVENGTTVLMWRLFGALICWLGTYVGINILINNANMICKAYNEKY